MTEKKEKEAPFMESAWMRDTNDKIISRHSSNPNSPIERLNCSLETLMDEARKDERKHERRIFIRILDEVWAEKGEAINKGLYAFTYEAVRGLIIDKLNENAEEDDEKYKGI
jgi:hypothetical protein